MSSFSFSGHHPRDVMYRVTAKCLFVLIFVRLRGGCSLPFKLQKGILKYDHHPCQGEYAFTRASPDRLLSITCTGARTIPKMISSKKRFRIEMPHNGDRKIKIAFLVFFDVERNKFLSFYSKK